MSLTLAALFAVQSNWDDPTPTGRWAAHTRALAAELLPPAWADDAVSHVVSRGILQNGPPSSVRFEGRPFDTGDGFCARKSYYVPILGKYGSTEGEPQKPILQHKVRLGGCEGLFAHINPGSTLEESKRVLRWLDWAQEIAAREGPLPFALSCRDETKQTNRCAIGARRALAALPLGKTFLLTQRGAKHSWQAGITETAPGQLLWSVDIDAKPGSASIDIAWKIPAPF